MAKEPDARAENPHELREVTILLAEDDRGHAELIRFQLQSVGVHNPLVRLRDGQETWDFLSGSGPGPHLDRAGAYALLLDLHMPKIDGIELLRRIKADAALAALPVIVLSTTDNPAEQRECARLGCAHFLTKPLEFVRFAEALAKLGLVVTVQMACKPDAAPPVDRAGH